MRVLQQADIIDPLLTEKERDTTAVDRSQEVVAPRNAPRRCIEVEEARRATRASRRANFMSVYTINTSGRPAAISALSALAKKAKGIAAIAIQEHHCTEHVVQDLQRQADSNGWRLHAVPATVKSEGPSAGVAVATQKHVPCAQTETVSFDLSPEGSKGRAAGLLVQAAVPGGILIVSVYLWLSGGLTGRSRGILDAVLAAVVAHGGPWLVVGDFNRPPSQLAEAMAPALKKAAASNSLPWRSRDSSGPRLRISRRQDR